MPMIGRTPYGVLQHPAGPSPFLARVAPRIAQPSPRLPTARMVAVPTPLQPPPNRVSATQKHMCFCSLRAMFINLEQGRCRPQRICVVQREGCVQCPDKPRRSSMRPRVNRLQPDARGFGGWTRNRSAWARLHHSIKLIARYPLLFLPHSQEPRGRPCWAQTDSGQCVGKTRRACLSP
jgi:hypothetical protein